MCALTGYCSINKNPTNATDQGDRSVCASYSVSVPVVIKSQVLFSFGPVDWDCLPFMVTPSVTSVSRVRVTRSPEALRYSVRSQHVEKARH